MKTYIRAIVYKLSMLYIQLLHKMKLINNERIFILGHMRAGTTLLTHILHSNPEIEGVGETHMRYDGKYDHLKLYQKLLLKQKRLFIRKKYLIDKILHKNYVGDYSIFHSERSKLIIIVREPESSIQSMMSMKLMKERGWSAEQVSEYYTTQLNFLNDFAKEHPYKANLYFLTYKDLTERSSNVLESLSNFLSLKSPLSSEYRTTKLTGRRGFGDSSSNITSGKILSKKISKYSGPTIDPIIIFNASQIYEDTIRKFKSLGLTRD